MLYKKVDKMSRLSKKQLSRYRQSIRQQLEKLEKLAFRCLYSDPVICATPNEVYRKCGKKNCKCVDPYKRHGPYKVLTITIDGRQRQFSIRKNEEDLWGKAVHYQYQIKQLTDFKHVAAEVADIIKEVIELRTEEFKKKDE